MRGEDAGDRRVIGDSWYAEALPGVTPLDAATAHWPAPVRSLLKISVLRGIALFVLGRSGEIVTTFPGLATKVCLLLCALTGRRRMVILELIVRIPVGQALDRPVTGPVRRGIEWVRRTTLARAMVRAQVLSESDIASYSAYLQIPTDRFTPVRWPQRSEAEAAPLSELTGGRTVLASGRRVDWATIIVAAEDTDWDLVLVCSTEDADEVRSLCRRHRVRTTIHVEVSQSVHLELVAAATVYVIAVPETGTSIGQIRVMNAIDAGAPLVVSDVVGLHGYVDDTTAALVPPADPWRLRTTISELLDDPDRRDALRRAAWERASYTMSDYLRDVSGMYGS